MVGDVPESIVLIWITKGETPGSPGTNMDHAEHFSDLRHALIASADPARFPVKSFPGLRRMISG